MADTKKYVYLCDRNHEIVSNSPVKKCLAIVKGKPCPGKLKSTGAGSRTKKSDEGG